MNIRPFEVALIGAFALIAIIGLFVLATFRAGPSGDELLYGDRVIIWGTLDASLMSNFLDEIIQEREALKVVRYQEIDPEKFEETVVDAIAEGKSPDLLIIPHDLLVSMRTKLQPISFDSFPQRDFRDAYIEGAEIFMRTDGVYGIPFAVDPLMMYWNRDIFTNAGMVQPPSTWEALVADTAPSVTKLNDRREIVQSAIAFGEYVNVGSAKAILSMLFLQTGMQIVEEISGGYEVTLGDTTSTSFAPSQAALGFYAQFAQPNRETYSWNRSRALDRREFTSGKLGLYFGRGSEWRGIERENPNLNYDIARVPQGRDATTLRTYGDFYAFAIPRASQRAQGAYAVSLVLSSPEYAEKLTSIFDLVPVLRSLHAAGSADPIRSVLYRSAVIARGWLDPSPEETETVFKTMIEASTKGEQRPRDIIDDAARSLEALF